MCWFLWDLKEWGQVVLAIILFEFLCATAVLNIVFRLLLGSTGAVFLIRLSWFLTQTVTKMSWSVKFVNVQRHCIWKSKYGGETAELQIFGFRKLHDSWLETHYAVNLSEGTGHVSNPCTITKGGLIQWLPVQERKRAKLVLLLWFRGSPPCLSGNYGQKKL